MQACWGGRGKGTGQLSSWVLHLEGFKGREFREGLWEDLNRIFIRFSRYVLSEWWSPGARAGVSICCSWSWHRPPGFAASLGLELKYS